MVQKSKTPARAYNAVTGAENVVSGQASDTQESIESTSNKQAQIAALQREFEIEAARIAAIRALRFLSIKATHAADNLALFDDTCAERDFEICREYGRDASEAMKQAGIA